MLNAYANPVRPTFSQAIAIAHALKQPVSVITGPPGTGKTRIIAGLALEQLIRGKSMLIASRINTAVDTAVGMVERLLGRGAILRTGNQDARAELAALASELAGWHSFQGAGEVWMDDSIGGTPTLRAETAIRVVRHAHGQRRMPCNGTASNCVVWSRAHGSCNSPAGWRNRN